MRNGDDLSFSETFAELARSSASQLTTQILNKAIENVVTVMDWWSIYISEADYLLLCAQIYPIQH